MGQIGQLATLPCQQPACIGMMAMQCFKTTKMLTAQLHRHCRAWHELQSVHRGGSMSMGQPTALDPILTHHSCAVNTYKTGNSPITI